MDSNEELAKAGQDDLVIGRKPRKLPAKKGDIKIAMTK